MSLGSYYMEKQLDANNNPYDKEMCDENVCWYIDELQMFIVILRSVFTTLDMNITPYGTAPYNFDLDFYYFELATLLVLRNVNAS